MKKFIFSTLCLCCAIIVHSQRATEDFSITLPKEKVENSLYKTIRFVDSRYDTSYMGIVQLGVFNKKARVIPDKPLSQQITDIVNALNDNNVQDGNLLFQLRQLYFAEITGAMSERGYCYLRADMFAEQNNRFVPLKTIDTVILVSSMDVTKGLFRRGSATITDFIKSSLTAAPQSTESYSIDDVVNIDNIEKSKMPLYTATGYKDGIYRTWESFKNQLPDEQVTVERNKNGIKAVTIQNEKGKAQIVKLKDMFALVDGGTPYISTEYGLYPLTKEKNDFYYRGRTKTTANAEDVVMAGVFFGMVGSLIASNSSAILLMKLDHHNGSAIPIKEIQ